MRNDCGIFSRQRRSWFEQMYRHILEAQRSVVMRRRLCLIVTMVFLVACDGSEPEPLQSSPPPDGETLLLEAATVADMKSVAAEVTTRNSAQALARISGTLMSLSVREGDYVGKGQRIGMVVDARIAHETDALAAQVGAADAEAQRARAELARIRDLYDHKVYAKARLDQAVAASVAADALLEAARARQRASASIAEQGAILAPESGRVLRADIPAGSAVTAGMTVATITAGGPVLRIELPESMAGFVRPDARVELVGGGPAGESRLARVIQVYPAITDGRVRVDAEAPGLSSGLIGRRAAVSIEVGQRTALMVPRRFVTTRSGIDTVEVIGADKRPTAVAVQIAPGTDAHHVEILSGAVAGDTLFVPRSAR
jgi:RND family efflux transporter MFP subunit